MNWLGGRSSYHSLLALTVLYVAIMYMGDSFFACLVSMDSVRVHYCILSASQYENQAWIGQWGTNGLTRPNWCDARGKIKQPREDFEPPPPGWRWEGDWTVSPELSIAFEPDEGLDEWTEDIFENQLRDSRSVTGRQRRTPTGPMWWAHGCKTSVEQPYKQKPFC